MQQIADATGVSPATVSRTVNDKFASTPRGTVELRKLFETAVVTEDGTEVSRAGVMEKLKEMVDAEDKASPLSDEKLALLLKEAGYPVARRTVAKYRGVLGMPGAGERRAK